MEPSALITAASLAPTPAEVVTKIAGDTMFMGTGLAASNCPVDSLSTCTSAVPVVGAFQGITKLICPGVTRYSGAGVPLTDRKSTRLNSRHANISYAVFCLEKKPCRVSGEPLPASRTDTAVLNLTVHAQ